MMDARLLPGKEDKMVRRRGAVLVGVVLLASILGCNLLQAVQGGRSASPAPNPTPPVPAMNSPQFTPVAPASPPPTLTPTPVPMVSVSTDTNCRSGPGKAYDVVGALLVGQTAKVVGQDGYGVNWIIDNPSVAGGTCWLYGQYATVTGDTKTLPVVTPPPTPTPSGDFTFAYQIFGIGPGFDCLVFKVNNTGSLTWESYTFEARDKTQSISATGSSNDFVKYSSGWCTSPVSWPSLAPGASGTVSVNMNVPSNPGGNHFDAALTLCSDKNLGGTCLLRKISFVMP